MTRETQTRLTRSCLREELPRIAQCGTIVISRRKLSDTLSSCPSRSSRERVPQANVMAEMKFFCFLIKAANTLLSAAARPTCCTSFSDRLDAEGVMAMCQCWSVRLEGNTLNYYKKKLPFTQGLTQVRKPD